MKFGQGIAEKDAAVKQALYTEFGDDAQTMARIESCFKTGESALQGQLTAVFGSKKAANFLGSLNTNVPG